LDNNNTSPASLRRPYKDPRQATVLNLYTLAKSSTMKEQDSFETLLDYPKENGLQFETHESQNRFYLTPTDPFLRTKYIVFKKDELYFCAYDSYATKAYMSNTYSGLYGVINLPVDFECKIFKKDSLDLFIRFNKKKTGNKDIDDKLTITTKSKSLPKGFLSDKDVLLFDKINNTINPIELLIQNDYRPIIKELRAKKVIGLETNQWIYKKEDMDVFINFGIELLRNIMIASA
jgi:hypothetical protein